MILDFVDHYRPHARSCIRSAESVRDLGRILNVAYAVDVAAERHSVLSGAKRESIAVTCQISAGVAGIEVNLLAMRIEAKTVGCGGVGVPVVLCEHHVTAR